MITERRASVPSSDFNKWCRHWIMSFYEQYKPLSCEQYTALANKLERRDGSVL